MSLYVISLNHNSPKTADPNDLIFLGRISLEVQMVLGSTTSANRLQKTCHAMEASGGYSHFSSVAGVNAIKDQYKEVIAF